MGFNKSLIPLPSQNEFAKLVEQLLVETSQWRSIQYNEEDFSLRCENKDGVVSTHYLANAYEEYCHHPESSRATVLQRYFVTTTFDPNAPVDLTLSDVMPRVRDRAYFVQFKHLSSKVDYPFQLLGEFAAVGLVVDRPTSMQALTNDGLKNREVTFEQALQRALSNLRARTKTPFAQPQPGVYVSAFGDSYDGSRIFLTDLIRSLEVKGHPIAVMPNRDTLIITGSKDDAGLVEMAALVKMAKLEPRFESPIPLELGSDDVWRTLKLDSNKSAHQALVMLQLEYLAELYDKQRTALQAHFEEAESADIAGEYFLGKEQSGRVFSCSVWLTDDEFRSYHLPQTDELAIIRNEVTVLLSFEAAMTIIGKYLKKQSAFPERWVTSGVPNAEEFQQLTTLGQVIEKPKEEE